MDYVTCGTGSYFDFAHLMPTSLFPQRLGEPFAAALKEVVTHAVVQAESHIRTPAAAEAVLAAGHADMVSIVRGQIADPHLVAKARRGRPERGAPVHLVQPAVLGAPVARLLDLVPRQPVGRPRGRVGWRPLRAGAGTSAGARRRWRTGRLRDGARRRRARPRGHAPRGGGRARRPVAAGRSPAEPRADPRPPGVVRVRARPARRRRRARLAPGRRGDRRRRRRRRGRGDRCRACRGGRSSATCVSPIGSRASTSDRFAAVEDVLAGTVAPSGTVLLVDDLGDWRGIGTAMLLQESGCDVTIVTSAPVVAAGLFHSAADIPARRRFASPVAAMEPHTTVTRWTGAGAELRSTLTGACERDRSTGWSPPRRRSPAASSSAALDGAGVAHVAVGDCVAPRRASLAIYEARRAAIAL